MFLSLRFPALSYAVLANLRQSDSWSEFSPSEALRVCSLKGQSGPQPACLWCIPVFSTTNCGALLAARLLFPSRSPPEVSFPLSWVV